MERMKEAGTLWGSSSAMEMSDCFQTLKVLIKRLVSNIVKACGIVINCM